MGMADEEAARPQPGHEIGQDLSLLSADELRERIARLQGEIARLEAELGEKGQSRAAAEAFFRR